MGKASSSDRLKCNHEPILSTSALFPKLFTRSCPVNVIGLARTVGNGSELRQSSSLVLQDLQ